MIGFLSGKIRAKTSDALVLNVNGVGYDVLISQQNMLFIGEVGSEIELEIYTHVTEYHMQLFGFLNHQEKEVFKKLISISGVGPKMGLAILSGLVIEDLIHAIIHEDVVRLTQISGVGKKTAERIIIELKDKFKLEKSTSVHNQSSQHTENSQMRHDALQALVSLGYAEKDIRRVLKEVVITDVENLSSLIKKLLGVLSK